MDRSTSPAGDVTQLLLRAGRGDGDARDRLAAAVYEELRRRAAASLRGERTGHTLQTTALVHEAWLRLIDQDWAGWSDRGHFLAVAATCMRRVLVDHARARKAVKRGGSAARISLADVDVAEGPDDPEELLALDEALERLGQLDPRKARVVELRLFAGLSTLETAEALQSSHATVERDLRFARAWLQRELEGEERA